MSANVTVITNKIGENNKHTDCILKSPPNGGKTLTMNSHENVVDQCLFGKIRENWGR